MPKRLLMLSHYFPPYHSVGVIRPAKFAKYLPEFGWEPTVLTTPVSEADPHYSNAEVAMPGTSYVRRVPPGTFNRFDEGAAWVWPVVQEAIRLHREKPFDACWITGGPFFSFLAGPLFSWRTRVPYVLDYRDGWTFFMNGIPTTHIGKLVDTVARLTEPLVIKHAASVVSVTPAMQSRFQSTYPQVPRDRFKCIPNGFDPDDLLGDLTVPPAGDRWRVVFTGTIYDQKLFIPLLEALVSLRAAQPEVTQRLQLMLVGNSVAGLAEAVHSRRLDDCVVLMPAVSRREALSWQRSADMLLNINRNPWAVSAKLYEYVSLGKPVLSLEPTDNQATMLLSPSAIFSHVELTDSQAIAHLLWRAFAAWRDGIQVAPDWTYIQRFHRRELASTLAVILGQAISRS